MHKSDFGFDPPVTRRDCVRIVLFGCCLLFNLPFSIAAAAAKTRSKSILDQFLGEELFFHIGYWFISHCGEAVASLVKTDSPNIYRASLLGRTIGFIDALVGPVRYSYVSYSQFVEKEDRLAPVYFQIIKKRAGKERHRYIIFDYKAGEIIFTKTGSDESSKVRREPMQKGKIYEDYLTLGYNLRHGNYGIPERGKDYQLPLYISKKKKSIELHFASTSEVQKKRPGKSIRPDKDYFIEFQVDSEDLSSGTGEVELWVTPEILPISGRIKDVAFFGDLRGNLIVRKFLDPDRIYSIPENVKSRLPIP
jgi:hypothetical protein